MTTTTECFCDFCNITGTPCWRTRKETMRPTVTAKTTPGGKLAIRGEHPGVKTRTIYSASTGYPFVAVIAEVNDAPYNRDTNWFDGDPTVELRVVKRSKSRTVVEDEIRRRHLEGKAYLLERYGPGKYTVHPK
jgi:hypothetical protein